MLRNHGFKTAGFSPCGASSFSASTIFRVAAWLLSHFAGFRRVTFYLKQFPSPSLLEKIGFREAEAGANVWLVLPNDEGDLLGEVAREGERGVSPIQTYLDL